MPFSQPSLSSINRIGDVVNARNYWVYDNVKNDRDVMDRDGTTYISATNAKRGRPE